MTISTLRCSASYHVEPQSSAARSRLADAARDPKVLAVGFTSLDSRMVKVLREEAVSQRHGPGLPRARSGKPGTDGCWTGTRGSGDERSFGQEAEEPAGAGLGGIGVGPGGIGGEMEVAAGGVDPGLPWAARPFGPRDQH